jgi:probable phosphoglycerate mutase
MLASTPFYYLRHGETDWNRERRQQGQSDIPLNETGRAQARAAAPLLADCGIAVICTSPLQRARETAEIVNRTLGLELAVVDGLIECNWGVGEGRINGGWYEDWRDGGPLEGAETHADFVVRSLAAINEALNLPGPVLIVGHGGVYRAVKIHARLDMDFSLSNSVPVRHDPPTDGYPWWTATEIETV